jgi:hypothetical protein
VVRLQDIFVPIIESKAPVEVEKIITETQSLCNVEKEKIEFRLKKWLTQNSTFSLKGNTVFKLQKEQKDWETFTEPENLGRLNNLKGDYAEDKAENILERSFLKDFIFRNPKFKSGKSEKELADFVISFFETLIIIQCKNKKETPNLERYIRKTVGEATEQLSSSYNRLLNPQFEITLNNKRQGEIVLNKSDIKKVITLVILEENYPIANYYLAKEILPEIESYNFKPQILNSNDLFNLLKLLDTPVDFFNYLEEREKVVTNSAYKYHDEKELFALYLQSDRKIKIFDEIESPSLIMFDGSFSEDLDEGKLNKKLNQKIKLDRNSYFIDMMLDEMHMTDSKYYLLVMEEFSKLHRFQRRVIGDSIVKKAFEVAKRDKKIGWRCSQNPNNKEIGFVFVISDLPRDKARILLNNASTSAKYKMKWKKVIGVGTTPPGFEGHYFDFLYDDREYIYPDENMEKFEKSFWGEPKHSRYNEFLD